MDHPQPTGSQLEQLIAATLVKVRSVDDWDDSSAKEQLQKFRRVANAKGALSHTPRRGCLFEYSYVLPKLHQFLPLESNPDSAEHLPPNDVVPNGAIYQDKNSEEVWREAESLVRRPHSFAALREIPELQQIISHTAVTAVTACAGQAQHMHVLMQDKYDARTGSRDSQKQSALQRYRKMQTSVTMDLFDHLAPALRLYLAAEVAVGMLCPSQPAPPDTPEHAAALSMFVGEAFQHVEAELSDRDSRLSRSKYNTPGRVQQLWAHMSQQQQEVQVPVAHLLHGWQLLPHLDLQMHLAPHQLLQLLVELQDKDEQHKQQCQQRQSQQQQQQGCSGDDAAGYTQHTVDNDDDGIDKNQTEQQQRSAAAGCSTGPSSTLPFDVATLEPEQLRGLISLNTGLAHILDTCCAFTSSTTSSSSSSSSMPDQLKKLLDACMQLSNDQVQQQQPAPQQQPVEVQDIKQFATALLQNAAYYDKQQPAEPCSGTQDQHSAAAAAETAAAETPPLQSAAGADIRIVENSWHRLQDDMIEVLTASVRALASCLVLQFIKQQWDSGSAAAAAAESSAWQRAVPLQVLMLLGQVQQIEGLIRTNDIQLGQASAADGQLGQQHENQQQHGQQQQGVQKSGEHPAVDQTAQCHQQLMVLLRKVAGMIQMMRQFKDSNAAHNADAAVDDGCCNGQQSSSSSGGIGNGNSCSNAAGMSPAVFFSTAGPLAAGPAGLQQPAAAAWGGPHNNSSTWCTLQQSAAAELLLPTDLQQALSDMLWEVVIATGQWQLGMDETQHQVLAALQDDRTQQQMATLCKSHFPNFSSSMEECYDRNTDGDSWQEVVSDLGKICSLQVSSSSSNIVLEAVCSAALAAQSVVLSKLLDLRGDHLTQAGIVTKRKWKQVKEDYVREHKLQTLVQEFGDAFVVMNGRQWQGKLDDSSDEEDADDQEDEDQAAAAGSSNSSSNRSRRQQLHRAAKVYRRVGRNIAQLLRPLHRYHTSWLQQQQSSAQAASQYWNSRQRIKTAIDAATGKSGAGNQAQHYVSLGPTTISSSSGRDSSRSSTGAVGAPTWPHGGHDCNLRCPLCYEDLQQQQQALQADGNGHHYLQQQQQQQCPSAAAAAPSSSSSSSSNLFTQPAVFPSDPFMWRRLLWQLLGKLSPAAQAFYAQYLAMCPHCMDVRLWSFIRESIMDVLWSPPTADAVQLQLSRYSHLVSAYSTSGGTSRNRVTRIKQYARAVNGSFVQGYKPAMSVLSKQLLLSLSSLHQSVLPPADVAPYLPSSFTPAVGKLLQQQIINRPVLDMFQQPSSSSSSVHLWHLWWHIGIRRYLQIQSIQQQQHWCSSVDDMYLDPDARIYAVGFAARQLSRAPAPYTLLAPTTPTNAAAHSGNKASSSSGVGSPAAVAAVLQCVHAFQQSVVQAQLEKHNSTAAAISSNRDADSTVSAEQAFADACQAALGALQSEQDEGLQQEIQRVLSLPAHLLSPAAVRHQQSPLADLNSLPAEDDVVITDYLDAPAAKELKTVIVDVGGGCELNQERLVDPSVLAALTDISEVALLPPLAVDSLIHPAVWWERQRQLMLLDVLCDSCGSRITPDTQVKCASCGCALYCSEQCRKHDLQQHSAACADMETASKRYHNSDSEPPQAALPGCDLSLGWLSRVLQPQPGEAGSLSVDCLGIHSTGPALVPKHIMVQQYKEALVRRRRGRILSDEDY